MNSQPAPWQQRLQARLDQRLEAHLYRQRQTLSSAQGVRVELCGAATAQASLLNFCSNDYLSLANHPQLIAATQSALGQYGLGAGASHLVCGHHAEHQALEEALAKFTGRPRALLFSSGFMANLGVLSALLNKHDWVFADKLNHASLLDGGLLSAARLQRFLHNDMDSLQKHLQRCARHMTRRDNAVAPPALKLIAVDGVFSMDGDLAQLDHLVPLAAQHQACLMVDDAHGFGVLGQRGAGVLEHFNVSATQVPVYMATLGKALGGYGAFVAGSEALIENLIQFSRSYIYTTALPPALAAASHAALKLLTEEAWRREKLNNNIHYFKQCMRDQLQRMSDFIAGHEHTIFLAESTTAIQPLIVGSSELALILSDYLQEQGVLVTAIRPPTVAAGAARLRITLNAEHSEAHIDQLTELIAKATRKMLHRVQSKQSLGASNA